MNSDENKSINNNDNINGEQNREPVNDKTPDFDEPTGNKDLSGNSIEHEKNDVNENNIVNNNFDANDSNDVTENNNVKENIDSNGNTGADGNRPNEGQATAETGPEKKLTPVDGIREIAETPHVILLGVLWVLLTLLMTVSAYMAPVQTTIIKGKSPEEQILDRMFYFTFFEDEMKTPPARMLMKKFETDMAASYGSRVEQQELDKKKAYEVIIVMNTFPDRKNSIYSPSFLSFFTRRKIGGILIEKYRAPWFRQPDMFTEMIRNVYVEPDYDMSASESAKYAFVSRMYLDNWFRDQSIYSAYLAGGRDDGAEQFKAQVKERIASSFLVFFIALGMFSLGIIIGPIILIVFVVLWFLGRHRHNLERQDIRFKYTPKFAGLTLRKALLILVLWDFVRFGFTLFKGQIASIFGINLQSGVIPGWFLFVTSVIMYGIIVKVTFYTADVRGSLEGLKKIGLDFTSLKEAAGNLVIGLGSYFSAVPVLTGAMILYQLVFESNPQSSNPVFEVIKGTGGPLNVVLLFLLVGVVGPVFEEILFRGFLYTSSRRYMPAWAAIILISFIFAVIHFDLSMIFPLFLLGAVMALAYERSGSLIPAIVIHCLWNSVTFIIFYSISAGF